MFTRFKARVTRAVASLTAVTLLAGTAAVGFAAPASADEETPTVWTPQIELFAADGVTPLGDTEVQEGDSIVVKGTGFAPDANVGGRGMPIPNTLPQGNYVVFGNFAENWRPSAGAASSVRKVSDQRWALTEATVEQIPSNFKQTVLNQWAELESDGTFETELAITNKEGGVPTGKWGVYTYAGSGVNNADQELFVPVNFTPEDRTVSVSGTGYTNLPPATAFSGGAYVAVVPKGTELENISQGGSLPSILIATAAIQNGAFGPRALKIPGELRYEEYELVAWVAHGFANADTVLARQALPATGDAVDLPRTLNFLPEVSGQVSSANGADYYVSVQAQHFEEGQGVYVAFIEKGTESDIQVGGGGLPVAFLANGADSSGEFTAILKGDSAAVDFDKQYEVLVWQKHTMPTAQTIYARSDVSFSADQKVAMRTIGDAVESPVVSGSAKVGGTLSVSNGLWNVRDGAYEYQWFRDGVAVPGATNATYAVVAVDHGKKLSARVTVSKAEYTTGTATAKAVTVSAGEAPKATAAPVVTGSAKVGGTLTVSNGTWNESGVTYAYQWLRDGAAISGATSNKYTIAVSDSGRKISVRVTATKVGYNSGVATSNVHTAGQADAAKATTKPSVTGTAKFNSTLRVKQGTWNVSGVKYNYQWLRNGKAIKGATKSTYKVKSADVGKRLSVKVTATKTGHANGSSTTSATKKIAKASPTVTVKAKKSTIKRSQKTTVTVTVKAAGVAKPTGKVTVKVGKKSFTKTLKASNKGKVTITVSKLNKGKNQKVTAKFTPSGSAKSVLTAKTSTAKKKLTVR
ncbi:hypothetical protein ACFSYH_06955 [Populibacterium corticicola]|uniref:Bacterial Ig-like domain-containing protein n=1 Tax=Populibacterium corticicola TaxID=1812826 RepID=A0ABW5XEZ8_9MICO